jgi:outer membrane protein OmpA-like peptidoglycan-associated protein
MLRKKTALLILLVLMLFRAGSVFGQADEHLVQIADEMYGFGDVLDALDVYKQALEQNPNNLRANFMAGRCYIETIHKEKSLPYFLKAYELDPSVSPKILYLIGRAYHLGDKFDQAIEYYGKYKAALDNIPDLKDKKKEAFESDRRINECENGKLLVADSLDNIRIENLGSVINSPNPDYGPILSPDEKTLYFTSRRKGSTGGNKDKDNEFFEDIFVTRNVNGQWTTPENIGDPVNTVLHESGIGISKGGNELFIYVDNDQFKGDIFSSTLDKGKWSAPKPLSILINTDFIENSITVSNDGKLMFFSSDKPGGIGGKDIYMSKMKKNGEWEAPVNLGYDVNTEFDEEGPFITTDGKTLYFSSKGHKGMGGYDLFKSVLDPKTSKWSAPENLGYPINSTDDDIYFVLSADAKYGYYASVKHDSYGHLDLYRIKMPDEQSQDPKSRTLAKAKPKDEPKQEPKEEPKQEPKPEPKPEPVKEIVKQPVELNIQVMKNGTSEPIDARIEITEKSTGKKIWEGNAVNGGTTIPFSNSASAQYQISAEASGFVFKNLPVNIPAMSDQKQVLSKTLYLEAATVGVRTIMRNIYFDFNQATLKKESEPELTKLLNMLKSNPAMTIEIDGHTDAVGSAGYNKDLSQKRAESVVKWLINKGVESSRVSAKGFGEEMPLASNDDEEEGREINRRTEFVILK